VISGLVRASTYWFRVKAVNGLGVSLVVPMVRATTLATVPGSVKYFTSRDTKATSITLNWRAPSEDGGQAITSYLVSLFRNGIFLRSVDVSSDVSSATISDLAAATEYQFSIQAANNVGLSAPSMRLTESTLAYGAPKAPQSITLIKSTTISATISWQSGASDIPITKSSVEVSVNGLEWYEVPLPKPLTSSASLGGLIPFSSYQIRVASYNNSGRGEYAYFQFSTAAKSPEAPINLTVSALKATGFTVSWQAPAFDGGAGISGYQVDLYSAKDGWQTVGATSPEVLSYTFDGLEPNTSYSVRIRAVNRVSPSANSKGTVVRTSPSRPATPTGLTVKNQTASAGIISWNAPSNGGSQISDYQIQISSDHGANWSVLDKPANTSNVFTLKNLKTKNDYQIRVAAINSIGISGFSETLTITNQ